MNSGTKPTVVVTGFGPFPGAAFNPTAPLVRALVRRRRPALANVELIPHVFATRYRAVDEELPRLLVRHRPDVVLMFGLAARTSYLRVETRARSVNSSIFPDAGGSFAVASRADSGPSMLAGRAPFSAMLAATRRARLQVRLSHNAGRYLCNYLYRRALESDAAAASLIIFVHVPKIRRGQTRRGAARRLSASDLLRGAEVLLMLSIASARRIKAKSN